MAMDIDSLQFVAAPRKWCFREDMSYEVDPEILAPNIVVLKHSTCVSEVQRTYRSNQNRDNSRYLELVDPNKVHDCIV